MPAQPVYYTPYQLPQYQITIDDVLQGFKRMSTQDPLIWETLVGIYFQEAGRSPDDVRNLQAIWQLYNYNRDEHLDDCRDKTIPVQRWMLPADFRQAGLVRQWAAEIEGGLRHIFEEAIRQWARSASYEVVSKVLAKAGWIRFIGEAFLGNRV